MILFVAEILYCAIVNGIDPISSHIWPLLAECRQEK